MDGTSSGYCIVGPVEIQCLPNFFFLGIHLKAKRFGSVSDLVKAMLELLFEGL